ncbi:Protein TPX2 [Bienertia sinuspersici]
MATPTKEPRLNASKNQENSNPNLLKSPSSSIKSAKSSHKSASKNPNSSPRKKIKERKFVVAKKNNAKKQDSIRNCKCKEKVNGKCLCVAYDNLRASQEEFFKSRGAEQIEIEIEVPVPKNVVVDDDDDCKAEEAESPKVGGGGGGVLGSSTVKRRRDIVLEEARQSVPEAGSGRVLHLVKAFERLLTMPKESECESTSDNKDNKKGLKWALPGLQHHQPRAPHTQESTTEFCPGDVFFNAQSLGLDANVSSSLDSSRGSVSSKSSVGSLRSRRRRSGSFSSETIGGRNRRKKKQHQHKVTSLRPFRLVTEQRGKMKEEEFVKKLQEMMIEEEKQRIPIAQGLPWTTDEPECLIKPPIKEITKPVDLKLHSDVRAEDRANFDQQVAEKLMLIEQYKMERERQQKLEEEEEIRRLRKELVPKAQPMPYFDRPFAPRRSMKQPTVPKEPNFQFPQQKKIKCSLSWDDFNDYIHAT